MLETRQQWNQNVSRYFKRNIKQYQRNRDRIHNRLFIVNKTAKINTASFMETRLNRVANCTDSKYTSSLLAM